MLGRYRQILAAAWVLAACAMPAFGQQPAATIVIDGSGSMAGWLDRAKSSKMDMVRGALAPALAKFPATSSVGLVAFGHRRKGNCTDVEAIVAPEPGGLEKTLAALPQIATTGKGPLVQALRQAAQGLGTGPARSIILLHDDADNCNQDACAAATEIAKSNPGLPIHVITLGAKPQTQAAMACVAKTTGGKHLEVTDDAQLTAALNEVLTLTPLADVPAPTPAVRPGAGPVATFSGPGLVLSASLTAGGEAVAEPVRWIVTKEGASEPLADVVGPTFVQAVDNGRYAVAVQLGAAQAKQTVDVADDMPLSVKLDLNAGRLAIAKETGGGRTTVVTIHRAGDKRTPVFVGRAPDVPLALPAGNYEVQIDDGATHAAEGVSIAAGDVAKLGRAAASGRLELDAISGDSGPAIEAVTYAVERDDPDAPQGRREVARSAAARPEFTLPAGTYYITARAKQVEARQQIAISAGTTVRQTMVLALARLSLAAKSNASLSPQGPALNFRVVRLDGGEREVARSSAAAPVLTLPAGRYRIEATLGSENARAANEADLQAGKDAHVTLDIPAGQVRLDRSGDGNGAIVEVADQTGLIVWHAGDGETASALLAPGRYTYRAPDGTEKTFDVRNGERQTLRLE